MSHIEIVPDQVGSFEAYGKRYEIHPATDVIMRFVDHEYDYLSLVDEEVQGITMHWLGASILNTLVEWGLPETKLRLKMTESEHEQWLCWMENLGMWDFEQEVTDIPEPTEGFQD